MRRRVKMTDPIEYDYFHIASAPADPSSAIDPIEFYRREFHKAIRAHKRQVWSRRIWIGLYVLSFLSAFGLLRSELGEYWWLWIVFAGGAGAGTGWTRKEIAWALSDSHDLRAVNILAIAALDGDGETRDVANLGLMKLLPLFQHSNAVVLSNEGMDALISLLGKGKPPLRIAILKALEQVGDERAVPAVERLTNSFVSLGDFYALMAVRRSIWPHAPYLETGQVRDAARECLPYLLARAEQKRFSSTLLRAADEPTEIDRTLLRAAASTETPEDQLLRPAL